MIFFKFVLIFLFVSYPIVSVSSERLLEADYKKIKDVFINKSRSLGNEVYDLNVDNFRKTTPEENESLKNKIGFLNNGELLKSIENGIKSNNDVVASFGNKFVFMYPNSLLPHKFSSNNCAYVSLVSSVETCISTSFLFGVDLSTLLNRAGLRFDSTYLSDFFYIHELAHLITLEEPLGLSKEKNVWVDEINVQYREVYSDLFSVIFLHNNLGYPKEKIVDILTFRDLKLFSLNDLSHYSSIYIKTMIKEDKWTKVKSFSEVDSLIKEVYKETNLNNVISKKRFKDVIYKYESICSKIDYAEVAHAGIPDLVIGFCSKII